MALDVSRIAQARLPDPNAPGFSTLAVELIYLIISFFPRVPVPCYHAGMLPTDQYWGSMALTSLSQTCRRLRDVLGPLVWDSFESCMRVDERYIISDDISRRKWPKRLRYELDKKTEAVVSNSTAEYIRVVTVALAQDAKQHYSRFADFLSCLPNLTTLQILSVPPYDWKDLNAAFSNKTYRSVTRIVFDGNAHIVASSFPNVSKVTVIGHSIRGSWHGALGKCPNITELDGNVTFLKGVWELPKYFPKIGICPFRFNLDPGYIYLGPSQWTIRCPAHMNALRYLHTIQFKAADRSQTQLPQSQSIIASAKAILRAVPERHLLGRPRRIKFWYDNDEVEIEGVLPLPQGLSS